MLRNNKDAAAKFRSFLDSNAEISTSSINIHELAKGANLSNNPQENLEKVYTLMQTMSILSFDVDSALISGKISALKEIKSKPIGQNDIFIAAVAISNNLKLVTRNKKHFENIPNLEIEEW